ncbi:MAG: hypothetical protein M1816_008132 [Peltula sp. TS41687]|nr:MAG: hypothetical protein M1816_008132 [Peltula sp. TS41687]
MHEGLIWRTLFKNSFDPSAHTTDVGIKAEFKKRCRLLRSSVEFIHGMRRAEQDLLRLFRTLIIGMKAESFCITAETDADDLIESSGKLVGLDEYDLYTSRNQAAIVSYVKQGWRTNFLTEFLKHHPALPSILPAQLNLGPTLLQVVQLTLSYLNFRIFGVSYQFGYSQKKVYEEWQTAPVFEGPWYNIPNIRFLLHVVNFFKYHMSTMGEHTLFFPYGYLPDFFKPGPWEGKLQVTTEPKMIGASWKGCHACLPELELARIRSGPLGIQHFMDFFEVEQSGLFQALELRQTYLLQTDLGPLGDLLDLLTPTRSGTPSTPINLDLMPYVQFEGAGFESGLFHVIGRLHHVPPQQRIPGWQRMIMIKYYRDEDGLIDDQKMFGYEGCVTPGSKMIYGRWWNATGLEPHSDDSGPFMLWNVPHNGDVAEVIAATREDLMDSDEIEAVDDDPHHPDYSPPAFW